MFLILPLLSYGQLVNRVMKMDTMYSYLSDSIRVKSKMHHYRPELFDSSIILTQPLLRQYSNAKIAAINGLQDSSIVFTVDTTDNGATRFFAAPSSITLTLPYPRIVFTNKVNYIDSTLFVHRARLYADSLWGQNTFWGFNAGIKTPENLSSGSYGVANTGIGYLALSEHDSGQGNTGIGAYALRDSKGSASYNTGVGYGSLEFVTTSDYNTGIGTFALFSTTTGYGNDAFGALSLYNNTTGYENIGIGAGAGYYKPATVSRRLFINNLDRGNYHGDTINSIIYGVQNDSSISQFVRLNANTTIKHKLNVLDTISGNGYNISDIRTGNVRLQPIAYSPVYSTLEDYINITGSSGRISGGMLYHADSGRVHVAPAHLVFKTTEGKLGLTSFAYTDSISNLLLTNNATNYIYAYYNNGNPIVYASIDPTAIFGSTTVVLGSAFREDNVVHIVDLSDNGYPATVARLVLKELERSLASGFGFAEHISGALIGSAGTRHITISSGVFYSAYDRVTNPSFNSFTTLADSFTNFYRDGIGGWIKQTGQYQINNTQWDDGSGTLHTLTNNRYGVFWVYLSFDANEVSVVFGQGDYQFADAETSLLPNQGTLPTFLGSFSTPIARIIVKKNSDSLLTETLFEISSVSGTPIIQHNDQSGLQGGTTVPTQQFYHSTANEYIGTGTGVFVRDSLPVIKKALFGKSTQGIHTVAIGGTDSLTGINIVRTDKNLDRTTLAQATDTSSISFNFTTSGKPKFSMRNDTGATVAAIDTNGSIITLNGFLKNNNIQPIEAHFGLPGTRFITTLGDSTLGNMLILNDIAGAKHSLSTGYYDLTFYKHRTTTNLYYPSLSIEGDGAANYPQGYTFFVDSLTKVMTLGKKGLILGTANIGIERNNIIANNIFNYTMNIGAIDTTAGINIVRTDKNLNRTTQAQATDTSSINFGSTQITGKPYFSMKNNTGQTLLNADTSGNLTMLGKGTFNSLQTNTNLLFSTSINNTGALGNGSIATVSDKIYYGDVDNTTDIDVKIQAWNGVSSITLSEGLNTFHGAQNDFDGQLRIGSGTYITKAIAGSRVYDIGSVAAGVDSSFTITVTGATVGMPVFVGYSSTPEGGGAIWSAYCTTSDVVTVRLQNNSAGSIDPASRTYRVWVFNF